MIEKTLILLGLKEKEVTVYLEVMRLGKTTPAQIAHITGINRATVYSVCKILIKKGLIQEDLGGSIRHLVALPPKELDILVEKERKRIKRKEELVEQAVSELAALPLNTQYAVPKIRFVEEDNIDFKADSYKWDDSLLKTDPAKSWWGFQDVTLVDAYSDWIQWYWTRAHEDISLRLLTNEDVTGTEEELTNLTKRQLKYFDGDSPFSATTLVIGEYLIMVYTKERPFYMIEIFNPTLAENYRTLFRNIWEKY